MSVVTSGVLGRNFQRILKFAPDGKGQSPKVHQFGLQHWMQVIDRGAVAMHQAMRAMPLLETEKAGAIDRPTTNRPNKREASSTLLRMSPPTAPGFDLASAPEPQAAQEMAQGLVHRQGVLLAMGEAVDVGQDAEFQIAKLEIQLATATELAEETAASPTRAESGGGRLPSAENGCRALSPTRG